MNFIITSSMIASSTRWRRDCGCQTAVSYSDLKFGACNGPSWSTKSLNHMISSNFRDTKIWATPRLAPEPPTIADVRSVFGRFWPKAAKLLCWNPLLKPLTMPSQHLGFMAWAKSYSFTVLNFPRGLWWAPLLVPLLVHKLHSHPFAKYGYIFTYIYTYLYYPINQLSHFGGQPYSKHCVLLDRFFRSQLINVLRFCSRPARPGHWVVQESCQKERFQIGDENWPETQ